MTNELKRLPMGIQTFSEIREGNYLYIDKTAQIYRLTQDCKYVFMSRQRRFGKSVLCSTLKSYFEGRHARKALEQIDQKGYCCPTAPSQG